MSTDPNPKYEDWTVRNRDSDSQAYVGITGGGVPVFYEEPEGELYPTRPEVEKAELVPQEGGPSIEPTETLGEAIERVGDELGWESLSEFAQEHLESESEDGSDGS